MSSNKNFSIVRDVLSSSLTIGQIQIGDVFEREGSLHMRVEPTGLRQSRPSPTEAVVCNLNTGAVWITQAATQVAKCQNVIIKYEIKK